MATGDPTDIALRMRALMPDGWFPAPPGPGEAETAPVLMGLLTGIGSVWAQAYTLFAYVRAQTRISSSTDTFVDATAADYFGAGGLVRKPGEADAAYIARIKGALFPIRATRAAVLSALAGIGVTPTVIVEPRNSGDTKGRGSATLPNAGGGYGYGSSGLRYGSMTEPFQVFVTIDNAAAGVSAATVRAAILPVLPAVCTVWLNLTAP